MAGTNRAALFMFNKKTCLVRKCNKGRTGGCGGGPALMRAVHAGMRDAEISFKVEAGERSRVHSGAFQVVPEEVRPEWLVFPFGKPRPTDPSAGRPVSRRFGLRSRKMREWPAARTTATRS